MIQSPVELRTREGKILKKQDCTLSDAMKAIRVVLWNEYIGRLVKDQCYHLDNVTIRLYGNVKYLSFSTSSLANIIEDIGDVTETAEEDLPPSTGSKISGEIIAIESFEQFKSCIKCNGKIDARNENIGQCTKCNCMMKLVKCQESGVVKLIIQDSSNTNRTVIAFTEQVLKITNSSNMENVVEELLSVGTIKVTVNEKMIVTSADVL